MTTDAFIDGLVKSVIDDNMAYYRETFEKHSISQNSELIPEWSGAVEVYKSLDNEKRAALEAFIQLVMNDTVSSLLSLIDGNSMLEGQSNPLELKLGRKKISGELQDLFLEVIENQSKP